MSCLLARRFIVACAIPLLVSSLVGVVRAGQEPVEKKESSSKRVDASGDPLPEGALARLGTTRFRSNGHIYGAVVSPDGKTVALATNSDGVVLLDLATGKELRKLKVQESNSMVACVAFSPDGKSLASQDHGASLSVWDVEKGELTKQIKGAPGGGAGVPAFSADGKVVATGSDFGGPPVVHVWDAKSGDSLGSFTAIQDQQVHVTVSPDGKTVASWGQFVNRDAAKANAPSPGETVQLWDVASGKEARKLQIEPVNNIASVAFAPDGKRLAVLGLYGSISVFDAASGKLERSFAGRCGLNSLLFSPNSKTLAGIGNDGVTQTWDPDTGNRLDVFEAPVNVLFPVSLIFTHDNRLLAWKVQGQTLQIWDVRAGRLLTPPGGHSRVVIAMGFASDGKTLLSLSGEGVACRWDTARGKEIGRWPAKEDRPGLVPRIGATAVSPDLKHIAIASSFPGVSLLDATTGLELCTLRASGAQEIVTFSPDGRRLVSSFREQAGQGISITDVASGRELVTVKGQAGDCAGVAFSRDGRTVACLNNTLDPAGWQGEIHLLDAATGKERLHVSKLKDMNRYPVFNVDASRLVVVGQAGVVSYDTVTGAEVSKITPPPQFSITTTPVLSPDGRTLAAAGGNFATRECRVQLWEMATGSLRREFLLSRCGVPVLAFAHDGRTLAVSCPDTSILLLDTTGSGGEQAEALTAVVANTLWSDLEKADASRADTAIWRLAASPKEAMPLLKKHLKVIDRTVIAERQISLWIVQLDAEDFDKREKASHELEQAGSQAKDALQKALDGGKLSKEAQGRVENLLERLAKPAPPLVEMVQQLRALEVLEHMATPEAKALLAALAKGDPDAQLTREAQAALNRLNRVP